MAICVELSRLLRPYVPEYQDGGLVVDFEDGKTVRHIIAELGIPKEKVFSVLVNRRPSKINCRLNDKDHVTLALILGAG